MNIGDKVKKIKGYPFPGTIVSIFSVLDTENRPTGEMRAVVQCTVPEVFGMLHIYNLQQLEIDRELNEIKI